jgi:hypothetical protein
MFSPYRVIRLALTLELDTYLDTYKLTVTREHAGNGWPFARNKVVARLAKRESRSRVRGPEFLPPPQGEGQGRQFESFSSPSPLPCGEGGVGVFRAVPLRVR